MILRSSRGLGFLEGAVRVSGLASGSLAASCAVQGVVGVRAQESKKIDARFGRTLRVFGIRNGKNPKPLCPCDE